MNGKSKTIKLSVMLILMIALMFSTAFMMIIKATEDTGKNEVKDAKYNGEYTIEYLIKHFNLVTLKDVLQTEHIYGPVLIGGDIKSNLYHSQKSGGISSYVKGKITGGNVTCNDTEKPILYLGSAAKATISDGGTNINSGTWYTNSPTVITDNYINFEYLFNNLKSQSKTLASSGTKVNPNAEGKIEIEIGAKIIIEDLNKVKVIDIKGDRQSNNLTLINIKNVNNVQMPDVHINGGQTTTTDSDDTGNSIVWNIPNATQVQMAESPSIGHIVAPNADVKTNRSNYAGCLIGKSLDGPIEGHYWKYNGISLPLKEIPKEEPKDKNNTTQNSTTKPSNNTTGNSTTASKNNTTKPKNNTTKPKNNTTKNNVAVANKTNKTNTSKNEDGMVLGAEWEKNNTSKNKTDKTTADGKLPQTGDEFSQKIVLGVVMIALVVVFGAKYIKHKNELDANK